MRAVVILWEVLLMKIEPALVMDTLIQRHFVNFYLLIF